MEIARSVSAGRLLRNADPWWLGRVERGLRFVYKAMASSLLLSVGSISVLLLFTMAARAFAGVPSDVNLLVTAFMALVVIAAIACAVVFTAGCWLISSSPGGGLKPSAIHLQLIRWCGPAAIAWALLCQTLLPPLPAPWNLAPRLVQTALCWSFLFAFLEILEHLERRTSSWEPSLVGKYTTAKVNFVAMLLLCTLPVLWSLSSQLFARGSGSIWTVGGVLLGVAVQILFFLSTVHRARDAVSLERKVALAQGPVRRTSFSGGVESQSVP